MRVVQVYVYIVMALFLCSCQLTKTEGHSVYIVAFENLPFEAVNCIDNEPNNDDDDGFQALCRESVRFTHAYTPNILSQGALASILTALWPFEHGVRHNGPNGLSPTILTVPELAHSRGFHTALFSGGAPILRKNNLQQGFELFDDVIPIRLGVYHRDFEETTQRAVKWGKDHWPFFLVQYVPDLQHLDTPDFDKRGRPVEKSYNGRLQRLSSQLNDLINSLKKQKKWDQLYFIVVGLNGYSDQERYNEFASLNLHFENTQVALLVKPPQKPRDEALNWKADANVSLVDLGQTLFDILGDTKIKSKNFEVRSLLPLFQAPSADWPVARPILIESSWAAWRNIGNIRYAIRSAYDLYVLDDKIRYYNSLTDRLELTPFKPEKRIDKITNWMAPVPNWSYFNGHYDSWIGRIDVAIGLWRTDSTMGMAYKESEKRSFLSPWLALKYIEQSKWKDLLRLAKEHKNKDWEDLAFRNLDGRHLPDRDLSPCLREVLDKNCDDISVRSLAQWSERTREVFLRDYAELLKERRAGVLNYLNFLIWDVLDVRGPSAAELILYRPEYKKQREWLLEQLKSAKGEEILDEL